MNNVIKLNSMAVTPADVMDSLNSRIQDMKEIYVVIKTHDMKFVAYSSGDIVGMAHAVLYLNRLATDHVLRNQEDL